MRRFLPRLSAMILVAGLSARPRGPQPTSPPWRSPRSRRSSTGSPSASATPAPIDGQASAATAEAVKACPDQDPVLRIETGMHVASIKQIGVDAGCKVLATGSDDKTVRLWSLPEGRLLRTIRLPIGEGNGGKVFAVALSPGRTNAGGRWMGCRRATRQGRQASTSSISLAAGCGGSARFESSINHIAFSADGTRVGVGLGGAAAFACSTARAAAS